MIPLTADELEVFQVDDHITVHLRPITGEVEYEIMGLIKQFEGDESEDAHLRYGDSLTDAMVVKIERDGNEVTLEKTPSRVLRIRHKIEITNRVMKDFDGGLEDEEKKSSSFSEISPGVKSSAANTTAQPAVPGINGRADA